MIDKSANKLTTPPATEPVTPAEVKAHLRLETDADDNYITSLISAAREHVENETRRGLIEQEWTLMLSDWGIVRQEDDWWDGVRQGSIIQERPRFIELPMSPLLSVTSVNTYDDDGNATLFDGYLVDTFSTPGRIALKSGATWPSPGRTFNGIEIIYKVGYGAAAGDVPAALRQAIKQLAGHWYENREALREQGMAGGDVMIPEHFDNIIRRYKVQRL